MLIKVFCLSWVITAMMHISGLITRREKRFYLPGTSVTLCCKNSTDTWSEKDSWRFNRTLVTSSVSSEGKPTVAFVLPSGCLHIDSVDFSTHPRYRCKTNQYKWVFHLIPREEKFFNSPHIVGSPVVKTGDNITIKGCQLPYVHSWNTNMFYWLKDGFRVISTLVTRSNNMTRFSDLHINQANQSHQGFYQCVMNVTNKNGDYVEIKSEKVNVQLTDVSHIRVMLTIMLDESNISRTQLQRQLTKLMMVAILNSTTAGQPIVQVTRLRPSSNGVIVAEIHVMYMLVTERQRITYCQTFRNLSVYSDAAFNITLVTVTSLDCCDEHHLESQGKGRYWYNISLATPVKHVKSNCKYSKQGKESIIYRQCKPDLEFGPSWTTANHSNCLLTLKSLKKAIICQKNVQSKNCTPVHDVADNLAAIVKTGSDVSKLSDLSDITKLLLKVTNALTESPELNLEALNQVAGVVSSILDARLELLSSAQIHHNTSTKIVKAMESISESIGRYLEMNNESKTHINKSNIALTVVNADITNILFLVYFNRKTNEIDIRTLKTNEMDIRTLKTNEMDIRTLKTNEIDIRTLKTNEMDIRKLNRINDFSKQPMESLVATIEIPIEAFANRSASIYSMFYKRDSFFLTDEELHYNIGNRSVTVDRSSVSGVLSTSFVGQIVKNLTTSIVINFNTSYLEQTDGYKSCAFWDFTSGRHGGNWSQDGCIPVANEKPGYITCRCNHLTNFAVLLHVTQSEYHHQFGLTLITWVGCGMSIMGLTVTIATIMLFKKVRRRLSQRILLHLCSSLLILLIVFLAGIQRNSCRICCQITSVTIHYFMLASFFWTTVEGINIYKYFVTVFRTGDSHSFLKKACLFAWGCPAVIVLLNAVIATGNLGNNVLCVVRGKSFYYAILTPVIFSLIGNFMILVMVLYNLKKRSSVKKRDRKGASVLKEIRIAFSFAILLGLTWLFGILAVGKATLVFQWLFCLMSSFQGFFIFLFHTVRNKEAVNEWRKLFSRYHHKRRRLRSTARRTTNV